MFCPWYTLCKQKLVYQVGALPTKVVCLTQVVSADELKDDEEYEDIMEDMRLEAGKYLLLISAELEFTSPSFPFLNMPFLTPIVSDSIVMLISQYSYSSLYS